MKIKSINKLKTDIMKTTVKFAGIMLIFLLAGNSILSAQNGRRNSGDFNRGPRMAGDTIHHHGMGMKDDSLKMRAMRHEMAPGHYGPKGYMVPGDRVYSQRGMGPSFNDFRRQPSPERRILESVPNVTEKQKKEISDLLQKHQDEMKKVRAEMTAKIQSLREENRKTLYNLLTDEQKKYLDSNQGNATRSATDNK
jgi:hypothetical protein